MKKGLNSLMQFKLYASV